MSNSIYTPFYTDLGRKYARYIWHILGVQQSDSEEKLKNKNHMLIQAKASILAVVASSLWNIVYQLQDVEHVYIIIGVVGTICLFHAFLIFKSFYIVNLFQVIWRSYILGLFINLGINIVIYAPASLLSAGFYVVILSIFHIGEYLATAIFNPSTVTLSSFILNHSPEYNLALLLSCLEHGILLYFYTDLKKMHLLIYTGLILCIFGDSFRKIAMYEAGKNFHHVVQYNKKNEHVLVTSGVYSLVRHPSYTGWFIWSIGSQILLCNPICFVGYTVVSWKFFKERIYHEEMALLNFFGISYLNYKRNVRSGIPFVEGYEI